MDRRKKRTSLNQYLMYIKELEQDEVFRTGNIPRDYDIDYISNKWIKLSENLNSCDNGPSLSPEEWKKRLNDWKNSTRCKYRRSVGGEKGISITALEKKALDLFGPGPQNAIHVVKQERTQSNPVRNSTDLDGSKEEFTIEPITEETPVDVTKRKRILVETTRTIEKKNKQDRQISVKNEDERSYVLNMNLQSDSPQILTVEEIRKLNDTSPTITSLDGGVVTHVETQPTETITIVETPISSDIQSPSKKTITTSEYSTYPILSNQILSTNSFTDLQSMRPIAEQLKRIAHAKEEKLKFEIAKFKFNNPGFNFSYVPHESSDEP